jgi:hypothetical protein
MTTDRQLWKFPLPDDWTPEGYWCLTITIPADQQYADIVYGALGALTQPKPFQPDETGDGPELVAAAFEAALYIRPFALTEDCYVVPNPPITGEEGAADWSAAIIVQWFEAVAGDINAGLAASQDCETIIEGIMIGLAPYGAGESVRGALGQVCNALSALSPTEREQYAGDCAYESEFAALTDAVAANPYGWLNDLSDFLFGWLNQTSDSVMAALNTAAGLFGGDALAGFVQDNGGPASGGGADFGTSCPFTHVFAFADGEQGWVPVYDGLTPWAEFSGGAWRSVHLGPCQPGWPDQQINYIELVGFSVQITGIEVQATAGAPAAGGTRGIWTNNTYNHVLSDGDGDVSGSITIVPTTLTRIGVEVDISCQPVAGTTSITQVTVHGLGDDPWA